MRLFSIFLVLCGLAFPALAYPQVVAAMSDIPGCVTLSPGPRFAANSIGLFSVVVRDAAGVVVPGATVSLTFDPGAVPLISWCGGAPPVLVGLTGLDGGISFNVLGGGCIDPANPAQACAMPAPATVTVVGPAGVGGAFAVPIPCIRSPDAVNAAAALPACPGISTCTAGVAIAGLPDAVFHTPAVKLGLVAPCSKMSPPWGGAVGVLDAILLTPYLKTGAFCGC